MQIVFSLLSHAFTIFFPISLQRQKILGKKASRADSSMKGRNWRLKTLPIFARENLEAIQREYARHERRFLPNSI